MSKHDNYQEINIGFNACEEGAEVRDDYDYID